MSAEFSFTCSHIIPKFISSSARSKINIHAKEITYREINFQKHSLEIFFLFPLVSDNIIGGVLDMHACTEHQPQWDASMFGSTT